MGRRIRERQQLLPLARRPTGPTAAGLRRVLLTIAVAGTVWLAFAADAGAVPTCPPQEVTTPYDTPVTVTLACIEPDPSLLPVTYHLLPGTTGVSISGDKATFTPVPGAVRPTSFNYLAANNMGTPGFGLVRVSVLPPPLPAPPPASPNHPPVAHCEHYSVKSGGTLSVARPGVLKNDIDPDGDQLRAVNKYTSGETFPWPFVADNGSVQFRAPTKPRMLSYRYGVTDGQLETTTTVTIWVGMKDRGCQPAFDPPPRSRSRETPTLRRVGGAVRIRAGGGWRPLRARHRLTRPTLVDARRGSVRVRLVTSDNYNRKVESGRLGGGVFKLGRNLKLPNGKVVGGFFKSAEMAGDLGCRGGAGPGRRLEVAAPSTFIVETTRLRTFPLHVRNRPTVARYSITDRCDKTTVVRSRAGRVYVRDHNKRTTTVLTGRQTYVARPRR